MFFTRFLFGALFAFLLHNPVLLSQEFGEFRIPFPVDFEATIDAVAADFNNDGLRDLFTVEISGSPKVYFAQAAGSYERSTLPQPFLFGEYFFPHAFDADLDGDQDLLVYRNTPNRELQLYLNDGQGQFSISNGAFPQVSWSNLPSSIAVSDIEGDGDMDICVPDANPQGKGTLMINQGNGIFQDDPTRLNQSGVHNFVLMADLDGTNGPDMLRMYSTFATPIELNTNDGFGNFLVPRFPFPSWTYGVRAAAAGDWDNDGDMDLAFVPAFTSPGALAIYSNLGNNSFALNAWYFPGRSAWTLAEADFDSDSDLDLILQFVPNDQVFLENDGGGNFAAVSKTNLPVRANVNQVIAEDLNRDGYMDLFLAIHEEQNQILWNRGNGDFDDESGGSVPAVDICYKNVDQADFDGDGDLDVMVCGSDSAPSLWVNDGGGKFVDRTSVHFGNQIQTSSRPKVKWIDLERDGDFDLIISHSFPLSNSQVFVNQGGIFTDATSTWLAGFQIINPGFNDSYIECGDLDGNGYDDVILISNASGTVILLNDGSKLSLCTTCFGGGSIGFSLGLIVMDVNQDAFADIVLSDSSQVGAHRFRCFLGNSNPPFLEQASAFPGPWALSWAGTMQSVDLNQDSFLDVIMLGNDASAGIYSWVWINNGNSTFREESLNFWPTSPSSPTEIEIEDMNADGREDLLVSFSLASSSGGDLLFIADAQGRFLGNGVPFETAPGRMTRRILTGDYDDDQDMDVLLIKEGFCRLELNLRRQMAFHGRTTADETGFLEFRNEPNAIAFLDISFVPPVPAVIPFPPFGNWRLGTQPVALNTFTLSASGEFSTGFQVPNVIGATLYWQCIFYEFSLNDYRLSNLEVMQIR